MVAFTSFVVFLAAAQTLLAAPLGYSANHGGRPSHNRRQVTHVQSQKRCPAKSPSSASPTPTLTATTSSTTVTTSAEATTSTVTKADTVAPPQHNALALVWPLSVSNAKATWSTSADVSGHVPLSDSSLKIFSGANTPHSYVKAPDGSLALRARYQKGSISPGHTDLIGGFSLYAQTGIDMTKGKEVLFSYKAYFEKGFDFQKGGKMPGLFLGTSMEIARKCSGGNHQGGECASSRLMFRTGGAGELYAYFPQVDSNTKALKKIKPASHENDTYGTSVGRGSFEWATGDWTAVSQRLKLNDVGSKNGEFQLWVNGVSVMNISGLQFRTSEKSLIRGAQLQTFFGGHDESWASPKDQSCWFKDISAAILS